MVSTVVIIAAVIIVITAFLVLRKNSSDKSICNVNSSKPAKKKTFTPEEVATHCSENDLWLIIKDKVYDFTDYIGLHPGGEAILRNAGRDSTKGFSGSQHPHRVWDMVR